MFANRHRRRWCKMDGLRLHCVVRTTQKSPAELKNGLIDSSRMAVDSGHVQLRKQIAAKWCISESDELITVFESDNFYEAKNQDDMRTYGASNTQDDELQKIRTTGD
eukprot:743703_1